MLIILDVEFLLLVTFFLSKNGSNALLQSGSSGGLDEIK